MQRPHLDGVAAPGHRQRFEIAQRVGLADLLALLPQDDVEQFCFGRRGAVGRTHRRPVVALRIAVVAERFGEPAAQYRDRRLHFGRDDHDVEIAAAPRGAGIVLHLQRSAHRIRQHDALQLDRQRGSGEFDILEFLARLRPFAEARRRQRPPQLRIVVGADDGIGEVLHALVGTADQNVGDRAQHQRCRFVKTRLGVHPGQL